MLHKRDWSIELMRIMACVIVIGCHTFPTPISVGGGRNTCLHECS